MLQTWQPEKKTKKFLISDEGTDAERLWRLMEWAELIHKDMAAFIGALDRFYMEKAIGRKAANDGFPFGS
jgi:hypothetical protein